MDNCLQLIIYRDNVIFDNVIVSTQGVLRHEQINRNNQQKINTFAQNEDTSDMCSANAIRLDTKGLVSYLVSAYIVMLSNSYVYRNSALRALFKWLHIRLYDRECVQIVFIKLRMPKKQFLDYQW